MTPSTDLMAFSIELLWGCLASIIPHDCVMANLGHTLMPGQMYLLGRILHFKQYFVL
jgi:hypothetical protein